MMFVHVMFGEVLIMFYKSAYGGNYFPFHIMVACCYTKAALHIEKQTGRVLLIW